MALAVTSDVIATLIAEAATAAPRECCGILLGTGERIARAVPAANIAAEPLVRFELDPAALFAAHKAARAGGRAVIGYYHSHPAGHPLPSATDCAHATGDGSVWAIVAGGEVGFWRDTGLGFEALSYVVADG
ncbi:MAG: M67 family metallopeptidase [Novosphingobium sp.]|nr:M67 family metallopeptidase [Novosphingobium sp.]